MVSAVSFLFDPVGAGIATVPSIVTGRAHRGLVADA
jgi:hypothetical protein